MRAPARTPLLAQATDAATSLTFETESAIAIASSRLAEVRAVLPGNRNVDHTQDVHGEKAFVLFGSPQPIPREIYLAHDRLFAVIPGSRVELQFEFAPGADAPKLRLQWEYWDGAGWTPFVAFPSDEGNAVVAGEYSEDGTLGLTQRHHSPARQR